MKFTTLAALTFGLLPAAMFGSTIAVDFGSPDTGFVQNSSTSAGYTFAPGFKIVASGYTGDVASPNVQTLAALHAKTSGGDEQGLGLADRTDFEIVPGTFVQLDLTRLIAFGASSFQLGIDSSSSPDAYQLYVSSQKGVAGSLFASGTAEQVYTFTAAQFGTNPYISLTATKGNVLVGPGTITQAPEPATFVSLGAGLLLAGWRYRKLRS